MLFLIILLITYYESFTVRKNNILFDLPIKYGFESGGKFNVKITNCTLKELFFLITTQDKMSGNKINYTNINFTYCIEIINGSGEISGNLHEKGIYTSKIISCEYPLEDYQIKIQYQNQNSFLSFNLISYLSTLPFFINISIFSFNLWIIICFNQNTINHHDILLTFNYFLFVFEKIYYYFYLKEVDCFDNFDDQSLYLRCSLGFNKVFGESFFNWFFMLECNIDSEFDLTNVKCSFIFMQFFNFFVVAVLNAFLIYYFEDYKLF